jgi:hypothetical protein
MMYLVAIGFALALGYVCWLLYRDRNEGVGSPDGGGDSGVGICDSSFGKLGRGDAIDDGSSGDSSSGDAGGGDGGSD